MPELRRDPVMGRWVIISTERTARPQDFVKEPEESEDARKTCPFCPGNEHLTPPEIASYRTPNTERNKPGWQVRVVPNKYPALIVEGTLHPSADGMYDRMNGIGAHEVIIETTDHKDELHQIKQENAEDVIRMYKERILDLKNDLRFEYILIFKNRGIAAGASVTHPHSQLIALPMVPVRVKQEQLGAARYYDYKDRCIFCDIIRQELDSSLRVISENERFVAFCPYASRFPFEIWILPNRHYSEFAEISDESISSLARILRTVLAKLNIALSNPPYNYLIHTNPLRESPSKHYHWHLELMPKLTKVAGFEWGTGFYINPVAPEQAAKFLQEI